MPRGDIMEAGMNEMDLEGKGQSEGKKEKKLVVLIFSVCIAFYPFPPLYPLAVPSSFCGSPAFVPPNRRSSH